MLNQFLEPRQPRLMLQFIVLMVMSVVVVSAANAQDIIKGDWTYSDGGYIGSPTPTKGDGPDGEAGCNILFWSGEGLLGHPCAMECKSSGGYKLTGEDYQSNCNQAPNNSMGEITHKDGDSCTIVKGSPEGTNSKGVGGGFFPNGHPRCQGVVGDPHLTSFDGTRVDLQASGEFVFTKSLDDGFEVQGRLESAGKSRSVSVVTSIAVSVPPYRITMSPKAGDFLRVDGEVFDIPDGESLILTDADTIIVHQGRRHTIVLPDSTNVHVDNFSNKFLNFFVLLAESRDGRMVGIGGNGDGNKSNDFLTATGTQLASPPDFETLYKQFAESWRVTAESSLFDYLPSESYETFQDPGMPYQKVALSDISLVKKARAEMACRAAGLITGPSLEDCIFDYALTGEELFIESAISTQQPPQFVEEPDTVKVEAPRTGFAAHKIELGILGPVKVGSWIGFAPKDSSAASKVDTPFSDARLNGKGKNTSLLVPSTPGHYELRYREDQKLGPTTFRIPFEVVAPEIEIKAASSAPVGGELEVTLVGDIGDSMRLVVVPAESTNNKGRALTLGQGTESTGTLRRLPKEAGEYELRVVSSYGKTKAVYAKRALRLE
ncbi:VWD domain-containing protein [Arenicella xantha]|uniref:von Willebrand factor type D domain-containing protein n=1 Tax=Arenicella xantha TaxID=644221 RepID=A0A395JGA0_9GAMM|nr:VWD domain-containing protein [Arenicella xantha]RBP48401.1 von Willebrand factor type D domain-containing protein [Arenicella xantha]